MGRASDVHAGPLLPRPRAGRTQTERQSRKTEKRIGLSHRMADPSRRLGWEEAGRQVVVRRVSRLDTAAHERRWIRSGGNRSRALGSVTARFAGAGVKIAGVVWGRAAPAKVGVERSRSSKFPGRGMLSSPSSRRLTRPLLERLATSLRVMRPAPIWLRENRFDGEHEVIIGFGEHGIQNGADDFPRTGIAIPASAERLFDPLSNSLFSPACR